MTPKTFFPGHLVELNWLGEPGSAFLARIIREDQGGFWWMEVIHASYCPSRQFCLGDLKLEPGDITFVPVENIREVWDQEEWK